MAFGLYLPHLKKPHVGTSGINAHLLRDGYERPDSLIKSIDGNTLSQGTGANILYGGLKRPVFAKRPIIVPIFTDADLKYQQARCFLSYPMSANDEVRNILDSNTQQSFLAGYCCIMATMYTQIDLQIQLKNTANQFEHDIVFIQVGSALELDRAHPGKFPGFLAEITSMEDAESIDYRESLAKIGLILTFMVKQMNEKNMAKYCEGRLRAFSSSLGLPLKTRDHGLDQASCMNAHIELTAAFFVRRLLFRVLYSAARGDNTGHKQFFDSVLGFFRFTDMNHMSIIMDYLLPDPGLLRFVQYKDNDRTLGAAIDFMLSKGEEAAFIRLLYPQQECQPILARTMAPYRDVGLASARYYKKSFDNYIPEADKDRLAMLGDQIAAYHSLFQQYALPSIIEGPNCPLNTITKASLLAETLSKVGASPLEDDNDQSHQSGMRA